MIERRPRQHQPLDAVRRSERTTSSSTSPGLSSPPGGRAAAPPPFMALKVRLAATEAARESAVELVCRRLPCVQRAVAREVIHDREYQTVLAYRRSLRLSNFYVSRVSETALSPISFLASLSRFFEPLKTLPVVTRFFSLVSFVSMMLIFFQSLAFPHLMKKELVGGSLWPAVDHLHEIFIDDPQHEVRARNHCGRVPRKSA